VSSGDTPAAPTKAGKLGKQVANKHITLLSFRVILIIPDLIKIMATPAHCFYCFESLAASYDGNNPISLTAVEELWERYEQFKKLAYLQDDDEELPLGETEASGQQPVNASGQPVPPSQTVKLPSIDRLQTQAASDGSVSTTPSAMSNKSSSSIFSSATTSSSVSSQSDAPAGRQHKLSEQKYPLFVTWNTLSKGGRKSLRGCIGTFEAQELSRGLKSYALTSYVHLLHSAGSNPATS
jgi:hypothetical protein